MTQHARVLGVGNIFLLRFWLPPGLGLSFEEDRKAPQWGDLGGERLLDSGPVA